MQLRDNERALLTLADASATEGEELAFVVTLTHPPATAVTLQYTISDGTSTPSDYSVDLSPGQMQLGPGGTSYALQLDPGATSYTIRITAVDDRTTEEAEETFTLQVSDPAAPPGSGGTTAVLFPDDAEFATATGTIRDNDGAPMIGIVTTTPSVTEADTAELVITASAEQTRALEVQLTLAEQCRADGSRGNFLGGPGDGSTPGGGCPLDGGTPGTSRTISITASLSSTSGGSSNSVTPTTIPVTPTTIRTGQLSANHHHRRG